MIRYFIGSAKPHTHYLDIRMAADTGGRPFIHLQLPAWRPGRYELADYARNVQKFGATDGRGNELPARKTSRDSWEIATAGLKEFEIRYNYFAFQLDAGACFLDEELCYVNPVNCLLYIPNRVHEPCSLSVGIPANFKIASALSFEANGTALAANYHELVDAPFVASTSLQQKEYVLGDYHFQISIQGDCKPDWPRMLRDFSLLTKTHIGLFGQMPVRRFHFLFLITSQPAYHGVEHAASCVIMFGPGHRLMEGPVYKQWLAICSHELFHCWNIKAIRPKELIEYDYSKEVYSYMGYVAEGVTTYFGDLLLLRSGLISWPEYAAKWDGYLTAYYHDEGRCHRTLAEASFDTWLDGYKDGAPGRTVSIYTKGAIIALMQDALLRMTGDKEGLDHILRQLYFRFARRGIGYTISDYEGLFFERTKGAHRCFFEDYVRGLTPIDRILVQALDGVGCRVVREPSPRRCERSYGLRTEFLAQTHIVTRISSDSPSDHARLSIGDQLLAINDTKIREDPDVLFEYYHEEGISLTVARAGRLLRVALKANGQEYFPAYRLLRSQTPSPQQQEAFLNWTEGPQR